MKVFDVDGDDVIDDVMSVDCRISAGQLQPVSNFQRSYTLLSDISCLNVPWFAAAACSRVSADGACSSCGSAAR